LTWNQAWEPVVQGCREQHGTHCWLYPPLVNSLHEIFQAGQETDEEAPFEATISNDHQTPQQIPVHVHSIELWTMERRKDSTSKESKEEKEPVKGNGEGDKPKHDDEDAEAEEPRLVAGELGYTVGAMYTSLTGFTTESSAGSIQMAALGAALQLAGMQIWDLGMDMAYKQALGATLLDRTDFVQYVHQHRVTPLDSHKWATWTIPPPGINARTLIDDAATGTNGS